MITQKGMDKLANYIKTNLAKTAACVRNGVPVSVPIFRTDVADNAITVYLLVDSSYDGKLTEFQLIDKDNDVFVNRADSIQKQSKNLLLVTFKIAITEVV